MFDNRRRQCLKSASLVALPWRCRRGFTLVELMVVVAIIGVVVSIAVPAVQYTRSRTRSTYCLSNLRQIGLAISQYLDSRGQNAHFPFCAEMPGVGTTILSIPQSRTGTNLPSLATVLASYTEQNPLMFQCPADINGPATPVPGYAGQSYYQIYGLSYDYPIGQFLEPTGFFCKTRLELLNTNSTGQGHSTLLPILWDYDSFHGTTGDDGARNYLFLDGHSDSTLTPTPGG